MMTSSSPPPTAAEDSMTALLVACRYATASQPAGAGVNIAPQSAPQSTPINSTDTAVTSVQVVGGKRNHESSNATETVAVAKKKKASAGSKSKEGEIEDNRLARLEKNRQAAVESRIRKKKMVEELHRSSIFYNKANTSLKRQNAELERQLLVAKQTIFFHQQNKLKSNGNGDKSASAVNDSPNDSSDSKPKAEASNSQTATFQLSKNDDFALFGERAVDADMEKQAQEAQFAATQALYHSMGYPAGAARAAASTFSPCISVSQTGVTPRPFPAGNKNASSFPSADDVSQVNSSLFVHPAMKLPPNMNSNKEDTTYIEVLNRFAMQQAAAANAAAAAANAAMQAVQLHVKIKSDDNSSSSTQAAVPPSFYCPPAGLPWQFQDQHVFPKSD